MSKRSSRLGRVLLGVSALLVSMIVGIDPAAATSNFDNVVQVTDTRITCQDSLGFYHDYDIGDSYMSLLMNGNSTFAAYMNAAAEQGEGWVVNVYENASGYRNLNVFVTTSSSSYIYYNDTYDPYFALSSAIRGSIDCTGWANGAPTGLSYNYNTSPGGREVATWNPNTNSGYKVVYARASGSYPPGYEGESMPYYGSISPAHYNGTVDCGGEDLNYLLIAQDGNTYSVPLTYENQYRGDWSYFLSSSNYTIAVGCGESIASSFDSVSPTSSSNDWVCNTVDDPHYCVLS